MKRETYFFVDVDNYVVSASGHDAFRARVPVMGRMLKERRCGLISCVGSLLLCDSSMLDLSSEQLR